MENIQPFKVVIPARYHSTRLPGKPLKKIAGKPMVLHVYEKACLSGAEQVLIATDDELIRKEVERAGAAVCMTDPEHATGTDRLTEVVKINGWSDDTIVVNVQGDEPLIPVSCINQVAANLSAQQGAVISTLSSRIETADEYSDPNIVKVVFDTNGLALLFSRSPIPYFRDADFNNDCTVYRHIGIYAYRAGYLLRYASLAECDIEGAEKLEQLRVLHNGDRIHVDVAKEVPGPGVDTAEQLAEVELIMNRQSSGGQ